LNIQQTKGFYNYCIIQSNDKYLRRKGRRRFFVLSQVNSHAAYRLGEMSYEKGDAANAILYYRKFLTLAKPDDRRIEAVKAKLAELEGTDQ